MLHGMYFQDGCLHNEWQPLIIQDGVLLIYHQDFLEPLVRVVTTVHIVVENLKRIDLIATGVAVKHPADKNNDYIAFKTAFGYALDQLYPDDKAMRVTMWAAFRRHVQEAYLASKRCPNTPCMC